MFTSINPWTEEHIASYPMATAAEIDVMITRCARAQRAWRHVSMPERIAIVQRLAALLAVRADDAATCITAEMGKPIAQARAEVLKCATVCTYYAEHAPSLLQDEVIPTEFERSGVRYEPLGLVLCIMPWNFPFWQFFRFAVPAILAGNGVLLKHAPTTWGSAYAAAGLWKEAGLPEDLVMCVPADVPDVARVIAHRDVRAVTFTGSTRGGAAVAALAGASVKKCVLELGGSDAYVVLDDADVDRAAMLCVKSRCTNSGQSCVAAKRFIVHEAVADVFTQRVIDAMHERVVGDPMDPATQIGPLARADLRDALLQQIDRAVRDGATAHGSPMPVPSRGFVVAPTVLTNVDVHNCANTEELFGPVAAIIRVASEEDAIRVANSSVYGLGAAVFTRSTERAERLTAALDAGMVMVNDFVRSDARLPFGGVKDSGYGRELGPLGIREFVNAKTYGVSRG